MDNKALELKKEYADNVEIQIEGDRKSFILNNVQTQEELTIYLPEKHLVYLPSSTDLEEVPLSKRYDIQELRITEEGLHVRATQRAQNPVQIDADPNFEKTWKIDLQPELLKVVLEIANEIL